VDSEGRPGLQKRGHEVGSGPEGRRGQPPMADRKEQMGSMEFSTIGNSRSDSKDPTRWSSAMHPSRTPGGDVLRPSSLIPLGVGTFGAISLGIGAWLLSAPGRDGALGAAALAAGSFALGGLLVSRARVRTVARSPAGPTRTDRELAALRRRLAEARDELDAFNFSVSHDLRSPIGAVMNFASVLEEDYGGELDAEARDMLARIRRSAESALAMLDGLLRFSRVARQPLRREPLDVEALVRDAYRSVARPEQPADLAVRTLPPVVADRQLLRAAFEELLANALKFGAGDERARVSVEGRREEDGTIVYCVADEGVGFDPRWSGKLFGVFERLHSRDEYPGAGLGLAVVRRIVERHGGRVWAESRAEHGARFFLALPPAAEGLS